MNFRDILLKAVTGSDEQTMLDDATFGRSAVKVAPDGSNIDKGLHAVASQKTAERWGPMIAEILGNSKELGQGALSAVQGKGFFGKNAYDPEDIEANMAGIRAANMVSRIKRVK